MSEERLITVAIHTYENALMLKKILEHEGIFVTLQNINLTQPVIASGVRIRIKEDDLPSALRIIENPDIFTIEGTQTPDVTPKIIVPIDFNDYSIRVCNVAFRLAQIHKATIIFIYSYIDPFANGRMQLSDSYTYDVVENETRQALKIQANKKMSAFISQLKEQIKVGNIPPIKFTYKIIEGIPEEIINECAKEIQPILIIMGTRGAVRREQELIGSVSAEVLDSCRFPTLTIPETIETTSSFNDLKHIMFVSSLSQDDILALDVLLKLFKDKDIRVTLTHISDKKHYEEFVVDALNSLKIYCEKHYKSTLFNVAILSSGNIIEDLKQINDNDNIDMLSLPNKKKNIFARLFNPSLAHKIMFNTDISMVVIPV